ncbi:MAG: putative transport system permease protein [Acidobacteriaceae bacterium]|nr:putative transport system permease protein [Acidobacteriaceae bacterium]
MSGLFLDIRFSLRQFRKSPGFATVVVVTLALGIGATTAMFSLVDRILFRSVPYPAGDQLVSVGVIAPIIDGEFLFARSYLTWRVEQTAFTGFTSSTGVSDCDLSDENPVRVSCAAVESTFLPTFGIQPAVGRNFTAAEDQPQAPKVALLSYGLWQSRFGGDRGVVGRSISLDGRPTRIVGVLPGNFEFPTLAHVGVLVPQALDESIVQRNLMGPVIRVFGRMQPRDTVEQAKAKLEPLFQDFVQSAPPPFRKVLRLQVHTIQDLQVHDARRSAWLLLASAWAVLLIACANVGNLVLSQSVGRRKEFAVRAVVGAGRGRLFQQRLTESIVLALAGGAAGCGIAVLIVRMFVVLSPAGIPHVSEATVDGRVLLFAVIVSIISGVIFGTVPALEKPATEALVVANTLGVRRSALRQLFIVTQVGIAVVLLSGALLLVRSLRNLQNEPLGMNTQNVLVAKFSLGQQKYPDAARQRAFFEVLEQRIQQLPGVSAAALSDSLPPEEPARTMPFMALEAEGHPPLSPGEGIGGVVGWRAVTPEYFSVLGIRLLRGRTFAEQDRLPDANALVLNESLRKRMFPGEEPIGKIVRLRADDQHLGVAFTVIGITGDTQNQGLGARVGPEYYVVRKHRDDDIVFRYPNSQHITVVTRTAMDAQTWGTELRNSIAALDPTLPVEVSTLGQSVARLAERPRYITALLLQFAIAGLLLTAVGIYGVVSLLVTQRTQEIGIRVALGAAPGSVTRLMVLSTSTWIGVGAVGGIVGALIAARWMGSLLFGIAPNDAKTLAEATLVLLSVALLGAWIPARRATKVDPVVALRYE